MFKAYVKVNGHWHKVYEVYHWYDLFCWAVAVAVVVCAGLLVWGNT